MHGVAVRSIAALEVARVLIRPWFTLAVHIHVVNRAIAASRMAIRREVFFGWHSTTSRARKLRPGTVKPWSSLIARARKSGVDSPGACRAPGWHGVRLSNAPNRQPEDPGALSTWNRLAFPGLFRLYPAIPAKDV